MKSVVKEVAVNVEKGGTLKRNAGDPNLAVLLHAPLAVLLRVPLHAPRVLLPVPRVPRLAENN